MGDIVEVRKHGFTVGWDMCIGEDTLEFRSKMDGLHLRCEKLYQKFSCSESSV
jgi:hypothetical protein